MRPAAVFVVTGVPWLARSLASFGDPNFTDPETAFDWFPVLSLSAALAALALSLLAFARMAGGRDTRTRHGSRRCGGGGERRCESRRTGSGRAGRVLLSTS